MKEVCIKIGACVVLIAIAFGVQSWAMNKNKAKLPEVKDEVEGYTISAEITHLDCDLKDGSLGAWRYLLSVRNVEKGFSATYVIDGKTYARYIVGETVTIKVTGDSCKIVED